jgi:ankyrin repeat protein
VGIWKQPNYSSQKGASVNALAKDDVTPLHCVAQKGNSKTAKILIEKGASVNSVIKDQVTPLHVAAITGNSKTAELLIEKGASVNALAKYGPSSPTLRCSRVEIWK